MMTTRVPYSGAAGSPLRTWHWLGAVARRHYVTLLTFVQSEEEWDNVDALRDVCEDVVALPVPHCISRISEAAGLVTGVFSSRPDMARQLNTRAMWRALKMTRRDLPVDLLHLDGVTLASYGRGAGTIPVIQVAHRVEHAALAARAEKASGWNRRYWRGQAIRMKSFEAAALRAGTRAIAVSAEDAPQLLALAPGADIHVVSGTDSPDVAETLQAIYLEACQAKKAETTAAFPQSFQ